MTIRFLEVAESELDEAVDWYRKQAPGLENRFSSTCYLLRTGSNTFPKHGILWAKAFVVADSAGSRTD